MESKSHIKDELERRARWAIISYSLFRLESALTIAIFLLLIFLYPRPLPWWRWWYWLILGIISEGLIVFSSITDQQTADRVVADMFRQRFNPREIRDETYRQRVEQALEYRNRIERAIDDQYSEILRSYLENRMLQISDWIANIFGLAKRLDRYQRDPIIRRDQEMLPKQIQHARARLKLEDSPGVREGIARMVDNKEAQLKNLRTLEDIMEKAELQMENSLTALGTLYSQLLIMDAKEVDSAQARHIAQSIRDQVNALQDVVTTMDQVYTQTA